MWRFILLGFFLLFLLVLLLRIRVCLVYESELTVTVRVLCFRFRLYPKRKKLRWRDFSARGISRRLKKDRAKALAEQKQEKKTAAQEKKKKKSVDDLLAALEIIRCVISSLKEHFVRHLRIDVARLQLVIGSEDAAKTAIEYGIAVQSVQYIVAILDSFTVFRAKDNMSIRVECDFAAQRPTMAIDIALSIRAGRAVAALVAAAAAYLRALRAKKSQNNDR